MKDAHALKLHTGPPGPIWFADGEHVPVESNLFCADFLQQLNRLPARVRVLGTAGNAALICSLVLKLHGTSTPLEVASPRVCETPAELTDPAVTLFRMRQCRLSPSQGGWHEVSGGDIAAYRLIARLQEKGWDGEAQALLLQHPAWAALSFIPHLNPERCARLLEEIIDPRWHVNPQVPDRVSRLVSFLGLCPANQLVVDGGMARTRKQQRCQLVLDTWASRHGPCDREVPANFLWRIYDAAGGGGRGHLRASQKFVVYLRHNWMQALYRHTRYGRGDGLFAPYLLFKTPAEIEAYKIHGHDFTN